MDFLVSSVKPWYAYVFASSEHLQKICRADLRLKTQKKFFGFQSSLTNDFFKLWVEIRHSEFKEAASKLRDKWGVDTLLNEDCLMGRTVMNQRELYFHDLGECFTHSKRIRTTHRNFSMGFGSQSLRQKLAQGGKFGRASETWISKNSLESHFSFIRNISLVVRPWIKMRYISLFQENPLYL